MVPKLTKKGYDLMVRALNGVGLQFSKIKIGNGEVPGDYTALMDLMNPIINIDITEITKENKYVILKAPMTNSDISTGFFMTELGIYAVDPDGGDDILYAYAHYQISGDEGATYLPPYTSNLVEITHRIHVYVGELDNVTAILSISSEYASAVAFSNHVNNNQNPHNVTKNQVGLGNVPNVTPENQKPVFSEASGKVTDVVKTDPVTGSKTRTIDFANILNGDTIGTILNKIRTAITVLLTHLNGKNPHCIDPETIGAASKTHSHSTNDITTGVLGLARGGTGCTTASAARANLGIQAGFWGMTPIEPGVEALDEIWFETPFSNSPKIVLSSTGTHNTPDTTDIFLSVKTIYKDHFVVSAFSKEHKVSPSFCWIAIQ